MIKKRTEFKFNEVAYDPAKSHDSTVIEVRGRKTGELKRLIIPGNEPETCPHCGRTMRPL